MAINPKGHKYTTHREIEFLRGLGNHCTDAGGRGTGLSREELQLRYLTNIAKRREWGDIDPLELMVHVLTDR